MREIWVTQRGVSDAGMEVMGGYEIERGRSLPEMTKICIRFQQGGQGSARSEQAKVFTAVKMEHARAGRFISGSDSREPRLRAEPWTVNKADSALVQACPSIPASLHPTLPEQLWRRPSQECVIRRKPSNRPEQRSQILARAARRRLLPLISALV